MIRALTIVALFALGCGGPPQAARQANAAAALAIAELDTQSAIGYTRAADAARSRASTWAEYDAEMRPWNDLELALRLSGSGVYAVDAAFAAWDQGGSGRWIGAAACLVASLRELLAAAEALGLHVPEDLRPTIVTIGNLAGAGCNRGL